MKRCAREKGKDEPKINGSDEVGRMRHSGRCHHTKKLHKRRDPYSVELNGEEERPKSSLVKMDSGK
jgi:hypothetical protein